MLHDWRLNSAPLACSALGLPVLLFWQRVVPARAGPAVQAGAAGPSFAALLRSKAVWVRFCLVAMYASSRHASSRVRCVHCNCVGDCHREHGARSERTAQVMCPPILTLHRTGEPRQLLHLPVHDAHVLRQLLAAQRALLGALQPAALAGHGRHVLHRGRHRGRAAAAPGHRQGALRRSWLAACAVPVSGAHSAHTRHAHTGPQDGAGGCVPRPRRAALRVAVLHQLRCVFRASLGHA